MPKTPEDLRKSREDRKTNLAIFGGTMPESIMLHKKHQKAMDLTIVDERAYRDGAKWVEKGREAWRAKAFGASGKMQRGKGGTLSRFPQNVGRTLLLFYTKPGDTVFDPFAGHNSRMEFVYRNGRSYIGCDISAEFMEMNRELAKILIERNEKAMIPLENVFITLHETDSRNVPVPSNSCDFTITSPPYWDIEYYGDEEGQLGLGKSYEEFLEGLYDVMWENYNVLKPGSFCVWCINDFRKNGKFYSYHEDTAAGLRKAGFVQHDIAITDFGGSIRQNFMNQAIEQKILPKRHEYALVFRKPLPLQHKKDLIARARMPQERS